MITSAELINKVKLYDERADEALIRKAYLFSMEAHGVQKRASGIPYFSHPLEVATILADLEMDVSTVVTGLLHDVVEDTNVTIDEIKCEFGDEIAFLVHGVTKLSKVVYRSERSQQADNFRKFLMAISEDVRVLVVKLADRLHNMRTLNAIKNLEKRKKISIETMDIYAPLAERIGMQVIKDELEDKAFFCLYPDEYSAILVKLEQIKKNDEDFIKNVISTLEECVTKAGIEAIIFGRTKKPCSIWKKMCKRNISLEQLNDILAFRILVNSVEDCYKALGVVHTTFPICPGRFKDYISLPKLNNYKSLHTTVFGPFQQKIEVQIRTKDMHSNAENGMAAHWSYKDGKISPEKNAHYKWLKSLVSILENTNEAEDALQNSKVEMYGSEVFCFSPKGDLISLPSGATAVDFAYAIHSSIGNTCIGAKVNGRIVPLKTVLKNGNQVEILTSPFQKPDALWLDFVVTGKAKACITKFVSSQESAEFIKLGRAIVKKIFAEEGVSFNEMKIPLRKFGAKSLDDFYLKVKRKEVQFSKIKEFVNELEGYRQPIKKDICLFGFTPGIAIHYASCCKPVPGDKVYGVLIDSGLEIHTESCQHLCNEKDKIGVCWVDEGTKNLDLIVSLALTVLNKTGSLAQVAKIISDKGINITNMRLESRSSDFYEMLIDVSVKDLKQLGELQAAIRTCSRVRSIKRV